MLPLDSELLTLREIARRLNCSLATLYRWNRRGVRGQRLAFVRIGYRSYVTRGELDRFVAAMSDTPTERKASDDFTERARVANGRAAARIVVFMNLARWVADLYLHLGGNDIHYLDCGIFLLSVVGGCLLIVLRERRTLRTWRRPPCQ